MNQCYLSLGSNQGSPERHIRKAIKEIGALPRTFVVQSSRLYWNKAWGMEAQQDFCNIVLEIMTELSPHLLLKKCHFVEKRHGKVKRKYWGPRSLDIDILLYGTRVMHLKECQIPHPRMHEREFVMIPLQEITRSSNSSLCITLN
jgi:2-amino-4-hydroxy-6-hydroxymethyldihydropteridine diphosphokinase